MQMMIANRYELITSIGKGGMAQVYKAKDTILNRIVAIKILRQDLSNDAMTLVRFSREASAASRLSHPNVVDIYDVGEFDGMHYIVMEYVKGRTLKQLINMRGALTMDEAVHIMKQLTSAIDHAHLHNIIHRDIKPQNVLVKDDGTIKITDFGIAVANDNVQLTLNNAVMGSAHYLAPETAQGKDPNEQVDIYSLGIVFYELLTGQVPYTGKTPTEIALKHLRSPMPFVRDLNPLIYQSVENIVLKATAKNPAERYQSAAQMYEDLCTCLDPRNRNVSRIEFKSQPVTKANASNNRFEVEYEPIKKPKQNHKKTWISVLLGTVATIVLCVVIFLGLLSTGVIRFSGALGYQTMPIVTNLTKEEALALLKEENFTNIKINEKVNDRVSMGVVISSNIKEGDVVPADTQITLNVCKGPSFLIEDYTGQYLEDVKQSLAGVNLTYDIDYQGMKDTNPGVILEQSDLEPGDRIDPDKKHVIHFVVSEYPSIIIPDDIIGKDVQAAKQELNALGIAVVIEPASNATGQNRVVDCLPKVGSTYIQDGSDSVVTLYYD